VTPIVRDAVESVRRDATRKGVSRVMAVAPSTPATVDPLRMQQIVANLLTNAVKFTPPGGLVRVSARRNDDATLSLDVSDTGVGITPELLPRIFDRFEQSRPGEHGGLGLGLAIVRHLVELHGGTIFRAQPRPWPGRHVRSRPAGRSDEAWHSQGGARSAAVRRVDGVITSNRT
jgi:signal transduction histidine kinase